MHDEVDPNVARWPEAVAPLDAAVLQMEKIEEAPVAPPPDPYMTALPVDLPPETRPVDLPSPAIEREPEPRDSPWVRMGREIVSGVQTLVSAAVYATLIVTFGFQVARVDG